MLDFIEFVVLMYFCVFGHKVSYFVFIFTKVLIFSEFQLCKSMLNFQFKYITQPEMITMCCFFNPLFCHFCFTN